MAKKPLRDAFDRYATPALAGQEMEAARLLPLGCIEMNPTQARQSFDEAALDELTASIREHGVLQPIGVRTVAPGAYRIIFGERRFRAASAAALPAIPAIIYEDLDEAGAGVLTALENLQREDLDLEEEARQFVALLDATGLSVRALAERLGKNHNYVARRVRLLKERPELFPAIRAGQLTLQAALDQAAEFQPELKVSRDETLSTDIETSLPITVNGRELFAEPAEPAPVPVRTPRAQLDAPGNRPRYRQSYNFGNWLALIRPEKISPEEKPILLAELAAHKQRIEEIEQALRENED